MRGDSLCLRFGELSGSQMIGKISSPVERGVVWKSDKGKFSLPEMWGELLGSQMRGDSLCLKCCKEVRLADRHCLAKQQGSLPWGRPGEHLS